MEVFCRSIRISNSKASFKAIRGVTPDGSRFLNCAPISPMEEDVNEVCPLTRGRENAICLLSAVRNGVRETTYSGARKGEGLWQNVYICGQDEVGNEGDAKLEGLVITSVVTVRDRKGHSLEGLLESLVLV